MSWVTVKDKATQEAVQGLGSRLKGWGIRSRRKSLCHVLEGKDV